MQYLCTTSRYDLHWAFRAFLTTPWRPFALPPPWSPPSSPLVAETCLRNSLSLRERWQACLIWRTLTQKESTESSRQSAMESKPWEYTKKDSFRAASTAILTLPREDLAQVLSSLTIRDWTRR